MASLHEILQPQIVVDVISRIRQGQGRLSRLLGMNMRGKNVTKIRGRYATFRIFDHTRVPSMGRAPGVGPATVPVQPIGVVQVAMARAHEKKILDYESIGVHLSPLPGPNAQVDSGGMDYITRQQTDLAERINNFIELVVVGMTRGQFYLKQSGDNWIPYLDTPTGNYQTINYQIPAGNLNQLNMLGASNIIDGRWDNPNTSILKHLMGIKAAFAQLTGRPLRDAFINSNTWYNVITNNEIRAVGGVAQTPYESYKQVEEKDMDGEETNAYYAVLRADPTIRWHIIDDVLAIDGFDPSYSNQVTTASLKKIIPDNNVLFMPAVEDTRSWAKMVEGSELVVEYPNLTAPTERSGFYAWSKYVDQPSAVELLTLWNGLPLLEVPKALAFGTVNF